MELNRHLQLEILILLSDMYPEMAVIEKLPCFSENNSFSANLFYLTEHNLIEHGALREAFGVPITILTAKITAQGLDFLEDDGGLGAILNKVIIKFDDNDLNELIISRLTQADVKPEKRNSIIKAIKNLPPDGVKAVYMRLINHGLDKAPDALDLIQKFLAQSP